MIKIKVKLSPKAKLPKRMTNGAAGYDLFSLNNDELQPGEVKAINTGVYIKIPNGFEGQIRSRSGLALKGVIVFNSPGTIDSDYTGEIKVILINLSEKIFKISQDKAIAQLVFSQVIKIDFQETKYLDVTIRGEKGFGSTDKNNKL